ncbi:MAG: SLBB domain-containing protein [Propionibacteriaceae bacterium]|jgi:Na+-translocating ferredoxin:NAD+ oxidoreductase RnfC subunit|nr:SLBB domain-containing protein [Propionibacteriaceae bacterium]
MPGPKLDDLALLKLVFAAGVIGAGGAGFPTHKKLAAGAKLLVVNAAECEPLLASDRYIMREFPAEIVAGAQSVAQALGIPRVVIGTKKKYSREIAALRAAIAEAGAAIEIFGVESFYPAGDEQTLIYEITGQSVPPGGIPLQIGIIVINATTALNIQRGIQGVPVTRRFVTVTGAVAEPVIVDAPVGTTVEDLIKAAGGTPLPRYAIVRGGPMMGKQFQMEAAATMGYGKADGGLIVLPADHRLIQFCSKPIDQIIAQTRSICIQCAMCTEMCPRYLIGHQMRPNRVMRSVGTNTHPTELLDALLCCECGICELYACPMGLSPRRMNVYVKGMLRAEGAKITDQTIHLEQSESRPYRRIAQSRLIERLGLGDYPTQLDNCRSFEPQKVIIGLRQGVGKPSSPRVAVGDSVHVGDVIAGVDFSEAGALIHASIDGLVSEVTADQIKIERK